MTELSQKKCLPCKGGVPPLTHLAIEQLLKQLPDWQLSAAGNAIEREFRFKNFYETMAFANAVAWIAHQENHHPALQLGYRHCRICYQTHAVGGLSENDFICAAKIDKLTSS